MTVFQFVFKRFFRKKSNSIYLLVLPIGAIFLPMGEWPPMPLGFHYYGIIILFLASRLTAIIMEDRNNKTLLRLSVAPVTHFQYLWQNLLAYTVIMTVVNFVFVVVGTIVHGESVPSPGILFILYTVFTMTALGFSLAWYAIYRNRESSSTILGVMIILMAMLGGVLFPVEMMPESMKRAVMLLPTYWIGEATVLIAYGAPKGELIVPILALLLSCIALLLFGSRRRLS